MESSTILKPKWVPIEQLRPGEKRRQKGLIKLCIDLSPEIMDMLIRSYGPYPLFWCFDVRAVVSAMIQELEAGKQGGSEGEGPVFMVTRKQHPMGLHSREAVRDAIGGHHRPLGCSTGSPTTSAAPFQSYPPTCVLPPSHPDQRGPNLGALWIRPQPFPIPLPPPPIPLPPPPPMPPPPPPPHPLPQFPLLRRLPPTNRHLQMSHMPEYRPGTRQISVSLSSIIA
ncbi:uncharacterized protein EI90DRAFT_3137653 [Cantharellus anzutake]|uniref:uncharacterized protein n=1 Tax=Cantharellus anzutake TaxID=1750568 RepID=UPI001908FC9A|nr:uncharacterized protein EI90DRAFT_3137653 [Cantharellus anzutake]KAF8312163.1 hypothetical protein EI90DRAFT_3137653 [Cantharellus anzutake]